MTRDEIRETLHHCSRMFTDVTNPCEHSVYSMLYLIDAGLCCEQEFALQADMMNWIQENLSNGQK